MNNNTSSVFPSLVFVVFILVAGGVVLSQYVSSIGEINTMHDQLNQMEQQIKSLSAQLAQAQQDSQKNMAERDSLRQQVDDIASQRDALAQQVQTLTTELNTLAKQGAGLAAERDNLSQQVQNLTNERDDLRNHVANLTGARDSLLKQKNDLSIDLEAQQKLADHWMTEAAALSSAFQEQACQIYSIPSTGQTDGKDQQITPAFPKVTTKAIWLLMIPIAVVSFTAVEVKRIWNRNRKTRRSTSKLGIIQVSMTRDQLRKYIQYVRSHSEAGK